MSILERLQYQQRTAAAPARAASIFDPDTPPARAGAQQLPRFVSLEDDLQASSSDSDEAQTPAQKQQKSDLDMLALICESESKQAPPAAGAAPGELASAGGDVLVVPSVGEDVNQQLTVGAAGDSDVAVTEEVVGMMEEEEGLQETGLTGTVDEEGRVRIVLADGTTVMADLSDISGLDTAELTDE
ncbi:uncharacterized protein LOC119095614 [Pollicipes pollicipes]|uniref:uncharacterized protein LOC119095614 n=1 Tax=Pollicipes pollicipes TaxID=41117 RepID=UPI0018856889|nr:uncharacterized protein LOC119095614 [Pollicipes pollicipes]